MGKPFLWKPLEEAGSCRVGTIIDARVRYNSQMEESAVKFQTDYHHRLVGIHLVTPVKILPWILKNIIVFSLKEQ